MRNGPHSQTVRYEYPAGNRRFCLPLPKYLLPMEQAFFSSWTSIARVLLVGVAAYAGLVLLLLLLRVSGKRTLTKMNTFDLVVTMALGSTLATVLLTKSVALADRLTAFALLILLQYGLTWLSVRF